MTVAGAVEEVTKENFREAVSEGLVFVDMWGPSCQPCFALMPHVERLAGSHEDVKFVKLEAPKARRLCIELKVMGLPAFLLFKDGQEIGRLNDHDISSERLEAWLDETLEQLQKEVS